MKGCSDYTGKVACPGNNYVQKIFLIMKLTSVLMLAFCMQVSAGAYSQELTLSKRNSGLEEVFEEVYRQSGYLFLYTSKVMEHSRPVTIEVKNAPLEKVLELCFKEQPFTYSIVEKTVVVKPLNDRESQPVASRQGAQQTVITGKVTDEETGESLPGVSVTVKNSSTGTSTELDGTYRLAVPELGPDDVLVFSLLGYVAAEAPAGTQEEINIGLKKDIGGLEEVVVVGYSSKRLSELSSSVTVVNSEELQGVTSQNLGTMLQGKVPGLAVSNTSGMPGKNTNLVIRGVGSIGAGYAPLYVVDGIIGGSADPLDIASVTVLKDAAATGLYGSRAANGVIIITTKRGQSGKTKVSYSGTFGISRHRDGNLEMMNSAELYANQREGYLNFFNERVAGGDPDFTGRDFDEYLETVLPSSMMNTNTDWQSLLTRTGYVNRHQVSLSGGSEKTRFYISGNYFNETGTLISSDYNSIGFRANLSHDISDRFNLQLRVSGDTEELPNEVLQGQEGVMAQYYINMPWDAPYEDDGTPNNPLQTGSNWIGNGKSNYFYDREHYSDITRGLDLNGDLKLTARITDWASFSTSNRWGFSGSDWKQSLDKYHVLAVAEKGRISQTYRYGRSFLTSNLLNLNRNFGDHYFSAILGQEYSHLSTNTTGAVGMDIALGLSSPNAAGSPKSISGNEVETGFLSYFGQLDYNYKGKYFAVGSLRRDASSRFGADNRWGTFYSLGASWMINREEFLEKASWIDLLKLRLSYGATGNANIGNYLSLGTYNFSDASGYDGNSGARPARIENPNLTWEVAYTTNIGVEFAFLQRFKVELDLYNRDNKDLLQNVPLPATSGFAGQQRNVGSVRNRGIDLNVSTVNLDGALRWETNFNLNLNKNEVLGLSQDEDIADGNMRIREGLPLRYFYMKEWAGVDPQTGSPLWVRWEDESGNVIHGADKKDPYKTLTTSVYNEASNLFISSAYPDFTGGIRNDLYYKNFSLSVLCNFTSGQWIYFAQRGRIDADGAHPSHNQMKPDKRWTRWQQPGDQATHPRLLNGGNLQSNNMSSRYLEDASYFRVQNVSLGYKVPHHFKMISSLNLHASVDNLLLLTKFSGADPDVNLENPVINQNASSARYSPTRKIVLGVSVEF